MTPMVSVRTRQRFSYFAFIGPLLSVLFFIVPGLADVSPADNFKEGQAAYDRGDYAVAVDRLTDALIRSPGDARAQRMLVLAGQKLMEREKMAPLSADELQKIIQSAQNVLDERQRSIFRALEELKVADRAGRKMTPKETLRACRGVDLTLEVSLGDDPASRRFREYLHSVCSHLEASLHAGILLDPADESRVLGYVAFCREDWAGAKEHWSQALKLKPKDSHLRDLYSEAEGRDRRVQAARRTEQKLAEINAAIAGNKNEEALSMLQAALKEFPGDERLIDLFEKTQTRLARQARVDRMKTCRAKAILDQREGRWLESAQSWLAVLQEDPLDEEAHRQLDRIRVHLGGEGAHSAVEKAASVSNAEEAEKLYTLGLVNYADGNLDGAVAQFRGCLKKNPAHAYARKALERVEEERHPSP